MRRRKSQACKFERKSIINEPVSEMAIPPDSGLMDVLDPYAIIR
jgi:hypothetical protein